MAKSQCRAKLGQVASEAWLSVGLAGFQIRIRIGSGFNRASGGGQK